MLASYRITLKQCGFVRLGLVPELLPQGAIKGSFIVGWIMAQRVSDTVSFGIFEVSSVYNAFPRILGYPPDLSIPNKFFLILLRGFSENSKTRDQAIWQRVGRHSSVAVGSTSLDNIGTKCASHCRQELLSKQRAQHAPEEISEVFRCMINGGSDFGSIHCLGLGMLLVWETAIKMTG